MWIFVCKVTVSIKLTCVCVCVCLETGPCYVDQLRLELDSVSDRGGLERQEYTKAHSQMFGLFVGFLNYLAGQCDGLDGKGTCCANLVA